MARSGSRAGSNRHKGLWIGIVVAIVLVVGVVGILAVSWLGTYRQTETVQAFVTELRGSLSARDWEGVNAQLPGALTASEDLMESTSGVSWRLLSLVPFIGSTANAVSDLAFSLTKVGQAALPLQPYAQRLIDGQLRDADGALDLVTMQEVAPLLERLDVAMQSASSRLAGVDVDAIRSEVAGPLVELRDELASAAPTVATASNVLSWVPGMLGADGSRSWMVMLQDPAEARGTGGLPGGYVVVDADQGALSLGTSGSSSDLNQKLIPVSDEIKADVGTLWGNGLGAWNLFNQSPHFPLTGELAAAGMKARGEPVSGVIAVNLTTVAAILTMTGPVTAAGVTVDSSSVEEYFTQRIYFEIPDLFERDFVTMELVLATFESFFAQPWEVFSLVEAMSVPISEGWIRVWSSVPEEEEWLVGTSVGGAVPETPGPVLAVAFNNTAGNKIDTFVETEITYQPGRCLTTTNQRSSVQVVVRNEAPVDLPLDGGNYGRQDIENPDAGSTSQAIYIYAPVGANYLSSTIDGQEASLFLGQERSRQVWFENISIDRGQERTIIVQFEEPTVLGIEPEVLGQIMVIPQIITVNPNDSCLN